MHVSGARCSEAPSPALAGQSLWVAMLNPLCMCQVPDVPKPQAPSPALAGQSLWVAMLNPICMCQVPDVPKHQAPHRLDRARGWQSLTLFACVRCPMFRSTKPRIGWTEPRAEWFIGEFHIFYPIFLNKYFFKLITKMYWVKC